MKPPHIVLSQVTKRFAGLAHPAVDQVSLEAPEGCFLALLGPSGCGKTTLLRLIAGFESPDAGSIRLGGRLVAGNGVCLPPERRSVGMVFQDFALFPHLTVAENAAFGLKGSPDAAARSAHVLELAGLRGLERRYPHELSGGQQQRVAVARALAPRPQVIVMDEPLSNLDVQMRLHLRHEIRAILKAERVTGILVTHDQEEALSLAGWVGVMRDGRLEQGGPPEEIYANPATRFVAEFVTQANFVGPDVARLLGLETGAGSCMVRQEDLVLTPGGDGPGQIMDRQFLGREYACAIDVQGTRLRARIPPAASLVPGARVHVKALRGRWFE